MAAFPACGRALPPGRGDPLPVTYILGAILTEVYCHGLAQRVIWIGFACNLLPAAEIHLCGLLAAAPLWNVGTYDDRSAAQASWEAILGFTPPASLGFVCGVPCGRISERLQARAPQDRDLRPPPLGAHDRLDPRRPARRLSPLHRDRLRRRSPRRSPSPRGPHPMAFQDDLRGDGDSSHMSRGLRPQARRRRRSLRPRHRVQSLSGWAEGNGPSAPEINPAASRAFTAEAAEAPFVEDATSKTF